MGYRNILSRQKNNNLGSSAIHLVGVDMIEIVNSILIIETYSSYYIKHIKFKY